MRVFFSPRLEVWCLLATLCCTTRLDQSSCACRNHPPAEVSGNLPALLPLGNQESPFERQGEILGNMAHNALEFSFKCPPHHG